LTYGKIHSNKLFTENVVMLFALLTQRDDFIHGQDTSKAPCSVLLGRKGYDWAWRY